MERCETIITGWTLVGLRRASLAMDRFWFVESPLFLADRRIGHEPGFGLHAPSRSLSSRTL